MSNIILLLGIGSSGKSTVAKELLKQLDEPYQLVGFDYAVMDLEKKYWPGGECEQEGFHVVKVMTEYGETPELKTGPIGKAFLEKMMKDIIALADRGVNLIIDTVPSDAEYKHLQDSLAKHRILRVGLKPPLEIVIEREINVQTADPVQPRLFIISFMITRHSTLLLIQTKPHPLRLDG